MKKNHKCIDKNNKKLAINSMKSYNKPNKNYLVIKIIYVRRIL